MSSFFVPGLKQWLRVRGASLLLNEKEIFVDAGAIGAVLVLDEATVVLGGEGKRLVGLAISSAETRLLYEVPSARRIVSLARLTEEEVLVVDSAGGVRSLAWKTGGETKELFGHFAPVTAALVLPDYIVTADVDSQVRVARKETPREIVAYLLGNASPVLALFRGRDDNEVVCVTQDRQAKYFQIAPEAKEIDPFANALPETMHKSKKTKNEAE